MENVLDHPSQWRVKDFPEGVRQLPKVLLFFNFFPKTAWKWKNLDPPRGASLAPPWIRQCKLANVNIYIVFDGLGRPSKTIRMPCLMHKLMRNSEQRCDDACDSALIENSGVAWKWVANPFWSDSIVFNESRISSVITALTLTLGLNGPWESTSNVLVFCHQSQHKMHHDTYES